MAPVLGESGMLLHLINFLLIDYLVADLFYVVDPTSDHLDFRVILPALSPPCERPLVTIVYLRIGNRSALLNHIHFLYVDIPLQDNPTASLLKG